MVEWKPKLKTDGAPIYLAIAEAIADDLRTGRLAPGSRLPPQRDMAASLGVNFTTVTRGYAEAGRRGLITSRVGQGTFVTGPAQGSAVGVASGGLVDMSMNLPPQFSDRSLSHRMWRTVRDLEDSEGLALLLRYQEAAGAPADRDAGATWLRERLPHLTVEQTLVAAGAQPALVAILTTLARPGDAVCAEALTYPGLRSAATLLGVTLHGVEMDAEGMIPESLEKLCRDVGPKAVYCTPTLQNPTTATMSMERREAIVAVARRRGVAIIEDDAYGRLPMKPLPPLAALAPEITYHIAGLAKVLSPALRIAYVAAPEARAAVRVAYALRAITGMASPLTAALATRWLETSVADQVLAAIRNETAARRMLAAEALGAAAAEPSEAFHLWLPLPHGWSRSTFTAELRLRDVAVVAADAFSLTHRPPEAVRIGLGGAPTREDLKRALGAMKDILDAPQAWGGGIV